MKIKKLKNDAVIPESGSLKSAGYDLSSIEDVVLTPGERKMISTGISVAIPEGYYGRVAPRSGLAHKHGIDVLAGVIDADYRGEIKVILLNTGYDVVSLEKHSRIAQLIIENVYKPVLEIVDDLDETQRGADGFGSTGVSKFTEK